MAFNDTLGIRRRYNRLKPPASSLGLSRLIATSCFMRPPLPSVFPIIGPLCNDSPLRYATKDRNFPVQYRITNLHIPTISVRPLKTIVVFLLSCDRSLVTRKIEKNGDGVTKEEAAHIRIKSGSYSIIRQRQSCI